jgi:hypothetical protein
MNYSDKETSVRVDFFRPGGKWYTTEAVDMDGFYDDVDGPKKAILAHLEKTNTNESGDPKERYRLGGMWAVCLVPCWKYEHPQMFKVPDVAFNEPR